MDFESKDFEKSASMDFIFSGSWNMVFNAWEGSFQVKLYIYKRRVDLSKTSEGYKIVKEVP